VRPHWAEKRAEKRAKHRIALALEQCAPIPAKGATGPRRLASSPSAGLRLSLQEKQEAIMNFQSVARHDRTPGQAPESPIEPGA
jgi:hypothetical protein